MKDFLLLFFNEIHPLLCLHSGHPGDHPEARADDGEFPTLELFTPR